MRPLFDCSFPILVFLFLNRLIHYQLAVVITAFGAYLMACLQFVALRTFYQIRSGKFRIARKSGVGFHLGFFTFLYSHLFHLPYLHLQSPSFKFAPHLGQSPLQFSSHKKLTGILVKILSFTRSVRSILSFTTG